MPPLNAIGGLVSGLLQPGPAAPPNLSQLFQTINNAGANQQQLIDALPAEIQQQYQQYQAANAAAAQGLQGSTAANNTALLQQTQANYSPTSPQVQAAETAAQTQIYAGLPAQQNAIRQALAATGGFGRGTAAKQLSAPVLQAGQQVNQANENITNQELQQQQAATQQAINTINSVDDATANKLFGMSTQQALAILNGTNAANSNQLAQLINQSNTQTQQLIGAEGTQAYNQAIYNQAQNAQQGNLINAGVNAGVSALGAVPGFLSGLNSPASDYSSFGGYTGSIAPANYYLNSGGAV